MKMTVVKYGRNLEIKSVFYDGVDYMVNDTVEFFTNNDKLKKGETDKGIIKDFFRTEEGTIFMILFAPECMGRSKCPSYYSRTFNHDSIPLYNIVTDCSNHNYEVNLL